MKDWILSMWESGLTTRVIASRVEKSNGYVCNVILRARDAGDQRAVQRRKGRKA